VRQDSDFQIKLSRGNETRLVVLDPHGRIIFNDEIDTPDRRRLVPEAVRERVATMEKALEATVHGPTAEIGRLDISPVEIR
jgi:predicted NBD/HSP70 family sugar kinase